MYFQLEKTAPEICDLATEILVPGDMMVHLLKILPRMKGLQLPIFGRYIKAEWVNCGLLWEMVAYVSLMENHLTEYFNNKNTNEQ